MPQSTQTSTRRRSPTIAKESAVPKKRSTAAGATSRKRNAETQTVVPDETVLREMVAVAAYFRAEHRGFASGDPVQDWVQAEAEIAQMFPR